MRWLARWWPVLVWALMISVFSTSTFTSENTGRVIIPVLHWLFPSLSPNTLRHLHFLVRKCAHFTEYFILSLLILRSIRAGRHETHIRWAMIVITLVAGYAALDEFHQSFVPGRTAAVRDVLIDTAGGVTAQVLAMVFLAWYDRREKKSELEGKELPVKIA